MLQFVSNLRFSIRSGNGLPLFINASEWIRAKSLRLIPEVMFVVNYQSRKIFRFSLLFLKNSNLTP